MTFCNVSRNVYGHWLTDCLPAVAMLRGRVRAEGRMLLAPPLKPWHRETLSRLGVLDLVREIEEPIVRVRDLLVSGFVDSSDVKAPSAGARATFQALGAGVAPGSDRLLYISRRGGLRRAMRNESDLEAMLARVGFVAIQPETLSIADQAAAFAGARVVVGAHGSGMANIGFAPAGCIVAEIVPSGFYGEWIERLATVLGHAYTEIAVATDSDAVEIVESGAKRFRPDWSYEVEVDRIVEAVKATML
jgi:capsular polysaccharide biosynthesis protein